MTMKRMIQRYSYILPCIVLGVTSLSIDKLPGMNENEIPSYDFTLVSRSQWSARLPKESTPLHTPVSYVTIHHSYTPAACYDFESCAEAMRIMQNMHMDDNGWWDIGYSFAVGSDGAAYEGRGWETMGAHAKHFNYVSIGICLIGDWTNSTPTAIQLKTAQALISVGVELGYIKSDYRLIGHRQVRNTECPGNALFKEIKTWHHYSNFPATTKDLLLIPDIPNSSKDEIRNITSVHVH